MSSRMRILKSLGIVLLLSGLTAAAYQVMRIPTNIMLSVRLSLNRSGQKSSGAIGNYYLSLTTRKVVPSDNVSLSLPWKDDSASNEPWALIVVTNETDQPWQHEYVIRPSQTVPGEYEGVVSQTIEARGKFRLWILLYGHTNGTRKLVGNKSVLMSSFL